MVNLDDNTEEIRKLQQLQDVLICQYDGKYAKPFPDGVTCLYTTEMECKYRVMRERARSVDMPDGTKQIITYLEAYCSKWQQKLDEEKKNVGTI
jgi:hypothetical protein